MTKLLAVLVALAVGALLASWLRSRRTTPRPWWARDYGALDMKWPENQRRFGK